MRDKRVLITGGAGLVGSHIADLLVQEGAREIVVLDNFVRGTMDNLAGAIGHGCVTVLHGDIRDPAQVAGAMEGIDVVFHQAAIRITQCAEDPRLALDVLATGSFNVFEAAAKAGVQKVIAASSASVLGVADAFPTTERHHPYNNRTIYGAAKTFNEGLLASFAEMYGLRYVALRYFNIYGPRMDVFGVYTEVLIRWMERLARGEAPIIFGDGSQTMDFVNVLDVARANLLAAKADVTDTVFNVASGTETSLKELAQLLAQVMEVPVGPEFAPERKVNPVPRRLADTTRAQAELGFSATISLEEGLRELVAWWRQAQLRKGVVA